MHCILQGCTCCIVVSLFHWYIDVICSYIHNTHRHQKSAAISISYIESFLNEINVVHIL